MISSIDLSDEQGTKMKHLVVIREANLLHEFQADCTLPANNIDRPARHSFRTLQDHSAEIMLKLNHKRPQKCARKETLVL